MLIVLLKPRGRNHHPFGSPLLPPNSATQKYKLLTVIDAATATLPFSVKPADTLLHDVDVKPFLGHAVNMTGHLLEATLLAVIYLGFLLAARGAFQQKIALLFPDKLSRGHAQRVFQRVRQGAEDYIGLQTLKAVVLAALAWAIMAGFGLHNAMFLAFLTLLVAYIPIVGPAAAVVLPTILAVLQFDLDLATRSPCTRRSRRWWVLLDSILLPRLQAEKLDVDPVVSAAVSGVLEPDLRRDRRASVHSADGGGYRHRRGDSVAALARHHSQQKAAARPRP